MRAVPAGVMELVRTLLPLSAVKILVTSSRMPYAITEIRAFGRAGHIVHALDTFSSAPGSHSRYVTEHHEVVAPREDPRGYAEGVGFIADEFEIDLVVPTFEEVFYLANAGSTVGRRKTPIFAPEFSTLARLHDKAAFAELVGELGLDTPSTTLAKSNAELLQAIDERPRYFARAAFSRAGTSLLTNVGPLAGELDPREVEPTPDNPWLVQEFVSGTDVCSFSVVRNGKVVAHSTYVHPKTIDSAGGIVFESIEEPRTLAIAQKIAEATNYHGQISFDFMSTDDGRMVLIECNPRPTAGVTVMPEEMFVEAVLGDPPARPVVAPAGTRRAIRSALLRDLFVHPTDAVETFRELLKPGADVYFREDDRLPGLYQFLSLSHVLRYLRSDEGEDVQKLSAGYLHDVVWDGEPLDQPSVP